MVFQPKNSIVGWKGNKDGRPPDPRIKLSKELLEAGEAKNRQIYFNFQDKLLEHGETADYAIWFRYHMPPPASGIDITTYQSTENSEAYKQLSLEQLKELRQRNIDFINSCLAKQIEQVIEVETETDGTVD